MKRAMLMGAMALAMSFGLGSATAATTTVECSGPLGVHMTVPDRQAETCVAGSLEVTGTPSIAIYGAIGPLENTFSGDIQVVLQSATGRLEQDCLFRATTGLAPSCFENSEGDWTDPAATCTVRIAGVGEYKASCTNTVPDTE